MYFTSLKIYIIDSVGNEESSALQAVAVNALNRSIWHRKPEIIPAALDTITEWMPAGHIQMQGFGPLKVMYNYEADLTEDVIQAMIQVGITVHAIFNSHQKLQNLGKLDTDESDAELDKMFLSLQRDIGKIKYIGMRNELTRINDEIVKIETKFNANLHVFLDEIIKSDAIFRENINKLGKSFPKKLISLAEGMEQDQFVHQHNEQLARVTEDHVERCRLIENNIKANEDKKLTKQKVLEAKAARFSIFANKIAKGYGVPAELNAEVHSSASQAPSPSSSSIR